MNKKAPAGNPSRANPLPGCPMAAAFAAIGGKWKLTLLYWLAHGESHFAGLRRRGTPITPKVLAEQLRELEADGLVERVETGPVPAPVIYRLTPYGSTVLPVVESVRVWGEAHLQRTHGESAPNAAMACSGHTGFMSDKWSVLPDRPKPEEWVEEKDTNPLPGALAEAEAEREVREARHVLERGF